MGSVAHSELRCQRHIAHLWFDAKWKNRLKSLASMLILGSPSDYRLIKTIAISECLTRSCAKKQSIYVRVLSFGIDWKLSLLLSLK